VHRLISVESDEAAKVVIPRNGRPAARLVPIAVAPVSRRIGVARGAFEVPADIDTSNADIERIFGMGAGA